LCILKQFMQQSSKVCARTYNYSTDFSGEEMIEDSRHPYRRYMDDKNNPI
jgi:hypothetical protein